MAAILTLYGDALETLNDQAKGLTTTHQGGEAYTIDAFKQLRRFLILGSEGGTFYVSERKLTMDNIKSVKEALFIDGIRVVNEIIEVSDKGLAPKNDPALMALAMAASYGDKGRPEYAERVRHYALFVGLPKVARIGTHLFHFVEYVTKMRGWGSGLRKAVANWYLTKDNLVLAHQVTKYQSRDKWSHRDLLRLAHPLAKNSTQNQIFHYVTQGTLSGNDDKALEYLWAVEAVKFAENNKKIIDLIHQYKLPREVLPTESLNDPAVWEALLVDMPMTAMIRNLGNMSKVGLIQPLSHASVYIADRLTDETLLKARIHPLDLLTAKYTYQQGHGTLGKGQWTVTPMITAALEAGFYKSFGTIQPTNKAGILAIDVSGSMTWNNLNNIPSFTPRVASAVMSMVTARVEKNYEILTFSNGLQDPKISPHDSLETVEMKLNRMTAAGTDCSLPITYAMKNHRQADYFIIYTDSETGYVNPSKVLRQYRQQSGIHDAKMIVVAMEANNFSIADPTDRNMLDCVGFSSDTPQVISSFIRNEF